jgi:RecA/RadA recombinase
MRDILTKHLLKVIKEQEKEGKLTLLHNVSNFPLSTGSLSLDFFFNGGIIPRFYTFAGPEQSGKSLIASTILASASKQGLDSLIYFDAEETFNADVVSGLFGVTADELLGVKDSIDSKRESKKKAEKEPKGLSVKGRPKLYVLTGNSLQGVMDGVVSIVEALPDKVFLEAENKWFFKFQKDNKESKELLNTLDFLTPDEAVSKKYGVDKFIFCADPNSKPQSSGLQAIIVIDSLASLIADSEKEDGPTQQMALEARLFSKHIKRFAGMLSQKQVAVLATNHTKENPNVMYGSKEYEPGGNALKFYASVQTRVASISSSTAGWGGTGPVFEEESAKGEGFTDKYQFKRFKLIKDKFGGGVGSTLVQRIWLEDCFGESRGYDPVLDTLEYLKMTNQLEESRGRYTLLIKHPALEGKSFTFKQFKQFILHSCFKDYELPLETYKEVFKLNDFVDLRAFCFEQLRTREVFLNSSLNSTTTDTVNIGLNKESLSLNNGLTSDEEFDPETGEIRKIPVTSF